MNAMSMSVISGLRKLQEKRRNRLLMQWAFDRLASGLSSLGITIQISVNYREGVVEIDQPQPRLDDFTWGLAAAEDMGEIAEIKAQTTFREEILERAARGAECYVVRHAGRIVAFTWCEVNGPPRPRFGLTFGAGDAYIFDAYTVPSYRGLNLLPFLEYQLLRDLKRRGCDHVLSSTDAFNRAARRYKAKLGARPLAMQLYVGILGRFQKILTIYRFSADPPSQ